MSYKNPVLVSKKNLILSKERHFFEVSRLYLIYLYYFSVPPSFIIGGAYIAAY